MTSAARSTVLPDEGRTRVHGGHHPRADHRRALPRSGSAALRTRPHAGLHQLRAQRNGGRETPAD